MLIPIGNFGLEYPAIPFANQNVSLYEATTDSDNTTITSTGDRRQYQLNSGEFVQFHAPLGSILADKPILLMQIGEPIPFYLQLISIDRMSNVSVLYRPVAFDAIDTTTTFITRIYTTVNGVDTLSIDDHRIESRNYRKLSDIDIYFYEYATRAQMTHMIYSRNSSIKFMVSRVLIVLKKYKMNIV